MAAATPNTADRSVPSIRVVGSTASQPTTVHHKSPLKHSSALRLKHAPSILAVGSQSSITNHGQSLINARTSSTHHPARSSDQQPSQSPSTNHETQSITNHTTDRSQSPLVLQHVHFEQPAGQLVTVPGPPFSGHNLSSGAPLHACLLYTSPSPRDLSTSRMPSSA